MMGYTKLWSGIQDSVDLVCFKGMHFGIFKTWDSLAHLLPVVHVLKWPRPQVWVFGKGNCLIIGRWEGLYYLLLEKV